MNANVLLATAALLATGLQMGLAAYELGVEHGEEPRIPLRVWLHLVSWVALTSVAAAVLAQQGPRAWLSTSTPRLTDPTSRPWSTAPGTPVSSAAGGTETAGD